MKRRTLENSTIRNEVTGCLLWLGAKNANGYGRWRGGLAHRRVREDALGPILTGMQLDHLCRNRDCVELNHLEEVTPRENTLRSPIAIAAINARKTHCPQGHEYTEANTDIDVKGCRRCKICRRKQQRDAYARKHGIQQKPTRKRPTSRPPTKPRGR